ncbi:MAG: terpene synthase family protein [Myxococcota bacterium]
MLAIHDSTALRNDHGLRRRSSKRLSERLLEWAERAGLTELWSERTVEGLRIDYVVDAAFPRTSSDGRTLAAAWILLFCAIDDLADGSDCSARQLLAQLDDLALQLSGRSRFRPESALGRACARFSRSMAGWDASMLESFHHRIDELFTAYVKEASMCDQGVEPNLARYIELRRTTSGMPVIFSLFPILTGLPLPEPQPRLQELEMWACDLVGWENDLKTVDKERGTSSNNLVFVLERAGDRQAQRAASELFEQRRWQFIARAHEFTASSHDESTRQYAAMLVSCVKAHHDWAIVTGRYDRTATPRRGSAQTSVPRTRPLTTGP